MAKTNRPAGARRNVNTARNNRGMYVDGNTARRLQETLVRNPRPSRQAAPARRKKQANPHKNTERQKAERSRQLSRQAQHNREKAMGMSRGFVVFLAVVCAAVLYFSINFLQVRTEISASMKKAAALETELTQLREDNDAYYSQVVSNVDLNEIKKIAIGRLGMKYPSDDQVKTYQTSRSSYVRQYQDIPESK
ncbi:MAG: hypothetical protein Q4C91_02730 [Eubacteriales bacterium]|nr:hypothetical protein [Eubacteriales bacterium]